MKSNDIPKILESFYESNLRTILIDGPWGSGKTYQVKEFLKNNKNNKNKTYYISLFGKESVTEINTELYNKIHPWRGRVKKFFGFGLSLINQTILPFNNLIKVDGIIDSLEYSLNDANKKTIKNSKIIIFDDLERVNEKLTYTSLLGYINSLHLNKIKVVFLASSENMGEDNKKIYDNFNEKILDRIYVINDTQVEIFHNYFNNVPISDIKSIIGEFDNNIRQAQKTSYLYKDIIKHANIKEYDIFSIVTPIELVLNCNRAVKLCFSTYEEPNITESDDYFSKYVIEVETKQYNRNIANGLYKYRNENKKQNIAYKETSRFNSVFLTSLLNIFLYDDYKGLDKLYEEDKKGITSENLLEQNYFYLSDENKKKYSNAILTRFLDNDKIITEQELSIFSSFVATSDIEISDKKINNIIDNILKSFENNLYKVTDIFNTNNNSDKLNIWIERIEYFSLEYSFERIKTSIYDYAKSNDYKNMSKIILDYNNREEIRNDEIKNFFITNDFFLPNIYKDIKIDEWQYAHNITKYSKDNQIHKELKEVFMKIYETDPNNNSLKERINSLTSKYFHEEIL